MPCQDIVLVHKKPGMASLGLHDLVGENNDFVSVFSVRDASKQLKGSRIVSMQI